MDGESTVLPDSHTDDTGAAVKDGNPGGVPAETRDGQPAEQEINQPEDALETPDRASHQGRRSLKLVLTLAPINDAGFRCLLAVGADNCDPLLRSVEVADLPATVREVESLILASEERWQSQPRNPASSRGAGKTSAKRSSAKQQPPDERSQESDPQATDSESAQAGQLPLFD